MDKLIRDQHYYVKQLGTKIKNVQHYSLYRAKYLGQINGFNKYMEFTNIEDLGQNHPTTRRTYVSLTIASSITKMESLKDITNEMLPNDILLKIDEYI
jgi:hypothetical protein